MNEIWANRLTAGSKAWEHVPEARKEAVKAVLRRRVDEGLVSADEYMQITGEAYPVTE